MDLSELQPDGGKRASEAGAADDGMRDLVGQLGRETVAPLSNALERVNRFATSGKIDRAGLRALRSDIEMARRLGIIGQQISRIASGRVRQNPARLNLTQTLRDALEQRARETAARGIDLRQELRPAEVMIDPSLLAALLQAMLDWCFQHARSHIEFVLDLKTWPENARLSCRFAHVPPDEVPPDACTAGARLDTLPWQLLLRLAQSLGLIVQREDGAGDTQLTIEFPHTVGSRLDTEAAFEFDDAVARGPNSQPMAGSHVLVVAARRETRNAVRETLRPMGLMIDYVTSVEEARQFCDSGMPHAIVYEAALAGENFQRLRREWSAEVRGLAFIEIAEQGHALEVTDLGGNRTSRVGRDAIATALPSALQFELVRDP